MRTGLRLMFKCDTSAAKLTEVLSPDNRNVPGDQTFKMRRYGNTVSFEIVSERPGSAFTSLDSVLTDAALFQEVWLLSHRAEAKEGKET